MNKKVVIGLSGGVDSATSAMLLTEQGYEVIGCNLLLTPGACPDSPETKAAEDVAKKLGIAFVTRDFRQRFHENVEKYFINEYLAGKTPNPCIMCNPTTKFRSLSEVADELGADHIATGHYAKLADSELYGGRVLCASGSKKDQSYFLARLTPDVLDRIIFPLADFISKDDVRKKAEEISRESAQKADSTEICFIPDNNYVRYICQNTGYTAAPGNFIDNDGIVIGRHSGIINYTVGQRKGLGAFGEPRYVKAVNAKDNTVTLCKKDERYGNFITTEDMSFAVGNFDKKSFTASVKIRSTGSAVPADIKLYDGGFTAFFHEDVLAPCPGQAAVIYLDGTVIGCGTITEGKKVQI